MGIRNLFFGILFICFFTSVGESFGQTDSSDIKASIHLQQLDLAFIDFLINNQEYEDALLLLNNSLKNQTYESFQKDSIHFLIGWAYYNLKILDSSIVYFEKIEKTSSFYEKAKFYESFEHLYLKQYLEADAKLEHISLNDSSLLELKKFQQAASALIQRNFSRFDAIANEFSYTNYSCSEEQKNLFNVKTDLMKHKKKSPLLAGLMSAVVPGTGKFYAGYRGQAISAMVPTFIFAAAAAESYYRAGPKSAQFITAASLFGIFYIGNIWGSVLSVKTFYELRNNEIHNNVMLDLHIPLRRIFSN